MKRMMPDFHKHFQCIAGACSDNCCIGWEIDIDPKTMKRYEETPGALGEKLRGNIVGASPHFRMNGDRCAFLNENDLCELILAGGEGMLCEICDQHPRFNNRAGDRLETGAGLCCEVALKQWLGERGPVAFIEEEIPGKPAPMTKAAAARLEAILPLRSRMFDILNDGSAPIAERLSLVLMLAENAQKALDAGKPKRIAAILRDEPTMPETGRSPEACAAAVDNAMIAALRRMAPIDEDWTKLVTLLASGIGDMRGEPFAADPDRAARLAVYILYRYMIKAVNDGDIVSRVRFAAVFAWLADRLDRLPADVCEDLPMERGLWMTKLMSKGIEYSEENLTLMLSECRNSMYLTAETLIRAMSAPEGGLAK